MCEVQNKTSKYNRVYWDKDHNKWRVDLIHNKKRYVGYFDNEEQAAMKVNLLCDKYEIKRKNSMIDIKMDAIQQSVIHSLSIEHGKVK